MSRIENSDFGQGSPNGNRTWKTYLIAFTGIWFLNFCAASFFIVLILAYSFFLNYKMNL